MEAIATKNPMTNDPLAKMKNERAAVRRGRLKIYLGMAAGVGKTYGMLVEGQDATRRGLDVVIGYLEPHGRAETEALAAGLEQLPLVELEHRGIKLKEFDVDAALARNADLLLVDELAHTNQPGSRHAKRWQDIEELVLAGMNVVTTVNIQHIESLRDVVAQITGVFVQETVPDAFFEKADESNSPEDILLNKGFSEDIEQSLKKLTAEQRELLILADIEGIPYREISEKIGAPVGTVRSRLHRTHKQLRSFLENSPTNPARIKMCPSS